MAFKIMSLTDAAAERITEIMEDPDKPVVGVRVGVKNAGCAGMAYTLDYVTEPVKGDDHWVTGRQRQGCRRCRGPVSVQAEVAGDAANRRTWWCPACQPGPGPEGRLRRGAGDARPRRQTRSSRDRR